MVTARESMGLSNIESALTNRGCPGPKIVVPPPNGGGEYVTERENGCCAKAGGRSTRKTRMSSSNS